MALPIHLPDIITFSIDPHISGKEGYKYDDFRLIAKRLKEGKKVKCRILGPVYMMEELGAVNMSNSLVSDNAWWFTGEARVAYSRKTGEEKWVKFGGWIGDSPGRLGSDEFYVSPEEVDESFGDLLEEACDPANEAVSIVVTTSIAESSSPVEMYD